MLFRNQLSLCVWAWTCVQVYEVEVTKRFLLWYTDWVDVEQQRWHRLRWDFIEKKKSKSILIATIKYSIKWFRHSIHSFLRDILNDYVVSRLFDLWKFERQSSFSSSSSNFIVCNFVCITPLRYSCMLHSSIAYAVWWWVNTIPNLECKPETRDAISWNGIDNCEHIVHVQTCMFRSIESVAYTNYSNLMYWRIYANSVEINHNICGGANIRVTDVR